jgi:hypothetical protein
MAAIVAAATLAARDNPPRRLDSESDEQYEQRSESVLQSRIIAALQEATDAAVKAAARAKRTPRGVTIPRLPEIMPQSIAASEEDSNNDLACILCENTLKNAGFPCGHNDFCIECCKKLVQEKKPCPLCKDKCHAAIIGRFDIVSAHVAAPAAAAPAVEAAAEGELPPLGPRAILEPLEEAVPSPDDDEKDDGEFRVPYPEAERSIMDDLDDEEIV